MSDTRRFRRGILTIFVGCAWGLTVGAATALAKPAAHIASASITSVITSGTSASPVVTVKGSGFGSRPAPNPSYPPVGKNGCPNGPAAQAGNLFGTQLYFTDLKAKKGTYTNWTAGQYDSQFFDCIGIIIDRWSNTEVRFHFGNEYAKFVPGNTYFLSTGDRFKVFVRGATFLVARTVFVQPQNPSARITSVTTSGTSTSPEITVKGSGFGSRPAPNPSYPPVGKNGCPNGPAAQAGNLFGTQLYVTDLKAKKGTYKNWTAGQYTPGSNGFFDCVGLLIDRWSKTEVRFHFGDTYAKSFPGNTYFLSDGDRFEVFLRGARFIRTATLH